MSEWENQSAPRSKERPNLRELYNAYIAAENEWDELPVCHFKNSRDPRHPEMVRVGMLVCEAKEKFVDAVLECFPAVLDELDQARAKAIPPVLYVGQYQYSPVKRRVDEYDFIHPKDFKKEFLKQDGWTNNPYIVSKFSFDEVMVCSATGIAKLSESPKAIYWKDEFSAGELWSLLGEGWVGENGQPKSDS